MTLLLLAYFSESEYKMINISSRSYQFSNYNFDDYKIF